MEVVGSIVADFRKVPMAPSHWFGLRRDRPLCVTIRSSRFTIVGPKMQSWMLFLYIR